MNSKSAETASPFEQFSRAHAAVLLPMLGSSLWRRSMWPCAGAAILDFSAFFWILRGKYTPRGSFGLANTITTLRAVLVLLFALPSDLLPPLRAAALAVLIFTLDGIDGAVARKRAEASAFGAHFDMETDALFVLMVTLRLALFEGYDHWVLTAGILRYAYVLSVWIAPGSGREAPRSLLGRLAFSGLMLGLIAGLALPGSIGSLCVIVGTLVVSASFARSFYFSHFAS